MNLILPVRVHVIKIYIDISEYLLFKDFVFLRESASREGAEGEGEEGGERISSTLHAEHRA